MILPLCRGHALLLRRFFSYGSADIAFAPYGDYWRQMRKICTLKLLSAKKVQSFSPIRQDEVSKLIESVQSSVGSVLDLTSKIYSLTSSIVMRVAIGDKRKDGAELVKLLHEVLKELGGFCFADLFSSNKLIRLMTGMEARLWKIHKKVDKVLEDILQENLRKLKKAEGSDDSDLVEENLAQVLLRIQQGDQNFDVPITSNNVKAVIWDMFGGGTDTAASVLDWAVSDMMRNPRVMEKAQDEVRKAFKEKKVTIDDNSEMETCEIKGYEIPIKTQVIIDAWALGRDPNYWYDAEIFIPERFQSGKSDIDFKGTNFEFIPFGAGRRICPGIPFGLASIELALVSLLYHFDWELPNGMKPKDLDMTETLGVTARRKIRVLNWWMHIEITYPCLNFCSLRALLENPRILTKMTLTQNLKNPTV
ncbi:cytochrome P450 71D8-like [Neltuma alba]|uniref:cytochrome P450 71D8-like n=1 Tax=Neltuma alba TaxID=207710 RepID=UPI0010A5452E|nr:cytochrome P450 71D8-like [Prosopis alba]